MTDLDDLRSRIQDLKLAKRYKNLARLETLSYFDLNTVFVSHRLVQVFLSNCSLSVSI